MTTEQFKPWQQAVLNGIESEYRNRQDAIEKQRIDALDELSKEFNRQMNETVARFENDNRNEVPQGDVTMNQTLAALLKAGGGHEYLYEHRYWKPPAPDDDEGEAG